MDNPQIYKNPIPRVDGAKGIKILNKNNGVSEIGKGKPAFLSIDLIISLVLVSMVILTVTMSLTNMIYVNYTTQDKFYDSYSLLNFTTRLQKASNVAEEVTLTKFNDKQILTMKITTSDGLKIAPNPIIMEFTLKGDELLQDGIQIMKLNNNSYFTLEGEQLICTLYLLDGTTKEIHTTITCLKGGGIKNG